MNNSWKKVLIGEDANVREALKVIDSNSMKVALVVDEYCHLKGLVADGDIRRGMLNGIGFNDSVTSIMTTEPHTAPVASSKEQLKTLMQEKQILAVPLIDEYGCVQGLVTIRDALDVETKKNPVFIMAGGFGTRLRPLTDNCPKPMLKVGGKPILHIIIDIFKRSGFTEFYISTHYLPEVIMDYFGDGSAFGVNIKYVHEDTPLGTGGALGLLPSDMPELPLIMINGDILTNVNFSHLLDFHVKNDAEVTMCVRDYEVKVPFGVVEGNGNLITRMVEKPTYRYFVNAGIYIISPNVYKKVNSMAVIDMPTLLEKHIEQGDKVLKLPIHEYWLDIGRIDDFSRAQQDIETMEY
ncbi:nucleotidyltransferase family protein [Pleionea sediminis]|uniref:nucleotidyltransferase family protein n=1 Tax=Pleionea sediminis TaxID=2569479 RepID=UPI001185EFCB|nr:nucleotidyltransferase family protein [Pleionea sediminis]